MGKLKKQGGKRGSLEPFFTIGFSNFSEERNFLLGTSSKNPCILVFDDSFSKIGKIMCRCRWMDRGHCS